jgi:hypothetical protein
MAREFRPEFKAPKKVPQEGGVEKGAEKREDYSAEFVAKVKAEFPGWTELHEKLDSGSVWVGRYLDDSRVSFKPKDVIEALEGGKQEKLLESAKRGDRIAKLYSEWLKICERRKEGKEK